MRTMLTCLALAILVGWGFDCLAADPPWRPPATARTGTTQPFGSGTTTRRSDHSSSTTRPFGSGTITTERTRDGRTITGTTS